jgi:hypothetical protein
MSVRRLHACICLGQKHLYSFAVLLRESRQNVAGICSSASWRRRHRSHAVLSIYAATVMGLDEKGQDYRGIVVTMIHKVRDMPAASLRCQLRRKDRQNLLPRSRPVAKIWFELRMLP